MKKNITVPGGLHTDNHPVDQPKGTTRFALNTVDESDDGNTSRRANEESNEECYQLKPGYIPLGQVYIGNNENLIFSVSADEQYSELGIVDRECNYTTVVNNTDLGFKIGQQIDATFRLRRGCERTVYWVDPKPRAVNLDGLDEYKNGNNWNISMFDLFRRYTNIPQFSDIQEGEGGNVAPGGYFFAVQYLDQDFNPTEFITSTRRVNVYNDSTLKQYQDIRGSSSVKTDFQDYGSTNKSVTLKLQNFDTDYPFYRIAILKCSSGTGEITSVEYSHEIPTEIDTYTYSGEGVITGTLAEVQTFPTIIDSAEHIEQLQSKLTLSNVKGKQINFCNLQKYASRIKADLVFKKVNLNTISDSNPKKPTAAIDGIGHMPGEIESYGIVYVFDDGSTSPAYHIPGKNPDYSSQMSSDNACQNNFYTDNGSCEDYWGTDSEGIPLFNQPVRHHRFPLRSEVNKPLVTKEEFASSSTRNNLTVSFSGDVNIPSGWSFSFTVKYTVGGVEKTYEDTLKDEDYNPLTGITLNIDDSTEEIIVTSETEGEAAGLSFSTSVDLTQHKINKSDYTTEIMGIEFSGIDIPSTNDTDGNNVIGYYIVKNERSLENKTILDSGVLTPTMEEPYYIAQGHLIPTLTDTSVIKQDVFSLLHPELMFNKKEYKQTTQILQEGEFVVTDQTKSSVRTQDVMAGTSYDPDVAKKREKDNDGFSLHTFTRDSQVIFQPAPKVFLENNEIKEIEYLNALSSKSIRDTDDQRKEVFNVSSDNQTAFVSSSVKKTLPQGRLPYVVLKRNLTNPYGNFRYLPYYKVSENINLFQEGQLSSTTIFAGDAYVSPVRYSNTFFYDTRIRERDTKSGFWNVVGGVLAVIGATILTIASGGTAAPLLAIAVSAMVAGFGITQVATGIKKESIARVYKDAYQAGLRDCIEDDDVKYRFGSNPPDDEVQWVGETITNLWFETTVNTSLRQGLTNGLPDFLDIPGEIASKPASEFNNEPQNELDSYILEKLTVMDSDANNGRLYQGFANAEFYEVNKDFYALDKSRIYHHLGIEYDCCSDCNETFKGRTHWSETSFQEELIDNFRVFLPNNYRDIEGETGEITNTFKIQNNFYIHTKEALWVLPENYQERVTGEILSFLGTGEFFNIPPKKILDDSKSSAGTRHKWGVIKTKYGVLFPCIDEKKWYVFNGEELQPITDFGNSKWFLRNMEFVAEKQYYASNKRNFPYSNNPVSEYGVGFISTYDTNNQRFILTKKDYVLKPAFVANQDYQICQNNNSLVAFYNYQQNIDNMLESGYEYEGIQDCRMKFSKQYYKTVKETREVPKTVPNTADLHFIYDTSGSFGAYDGPDLTSIKDAVTTWLADFRISNPDWTGNVYEYPDATERWLAYPEKIANQTYAGQDLSQKDIIVVSFCNESTPYGNSSGLQSPTIQAPTATYTEDYNNFLQIHSLYKSFVGIHYPIVFSSGTYSSQGKALVQQSLAAIKGVSYTRAEVDTIERNVVFTDAEWNTLKDSLVVSNPYPDDGLENYGWIGKWNRNNIGSIINPVDFAQDINALLAGRKATESVEVEVQIPVTVFNHIDGEAISKDEFILADNSWTISYSLKRKEWVSWHSFLPSFYLYTPGKFYSWINGSDYMWRHNKKGHYQTFYGQYYPHIIEEVSVSDKMQPRVFEDIGFQTEAQKYFENEEEFNVINNVTFNKLLAYNSRQITGELTLRNKNNGDVNYLAEQVDYVSGEITLENNEGTWQVNALRDMRVDANVPMFKSDLISRQLAYFTDKVVNDNAISTNKPWFEQESLRDKYLVIRFIFDTFDNIKLITKHSFENEDISNR